MSTTGFRKIREENLEMIMRWRMTPEITRFMYTDPLLTLDTQKAWYKRICEDMDSYYWIYQVDGNPAGLVSLAGWDKKNNIIHSGSYIAVHEFRGLQNILDMNMNLLAFPLEVLGVNKVAMEIMGNNTGQLRWVMRFGATKEGVLRQAILKNGQYYDVHLFSVLANEWDNIKRKIRFNRFEIEV